ncbi:hypothetical protein TNCV_3654301 [Trichonephila clavipes]|nr:hypothetical protein TNCV_3654301 [Trichonephila clavipes]
MPIQAISVEAQNSHVGIVWKLGRITQLLLSSFNHDSKLLIVNGFRVAYKYNVNKESIHLARSSRTVFMRKVMDGIVKEKKLRVKYLIGIFIHLSETSAHVETSIPQLFKTVAPRLNRKTTAGAHSYVGERSLKNREN